jgi:F-type H+-transporting ATPase subunit b
MSTSFILAATATTADAGGGAAQEIARTFGWTPQLFFSQVVVFLIVAFMLKKFAFKPMLAMLEQRRATIEQGLKHAEQMKQELANAQVKAQELLGQAGQQATKIVEEARAAAGVVAEQERQRAITDAQNILAKAHDAGEAELSRLKGELRKEFGRLVVQAAARSTGDVLSGDQKNRLAEDAVRQLAA